MPSRTDLIDLVRPLTIFISREVPEYSRKTNNLPASTVAVRRALLEARDPVRLVFTMIPEACGLPPISGAGLKKPEELAVRLRTALHEIRTAYPQLLSRLGGSNLPRPLIVESALPWRQKHHRGPRGSTAACRHIRYAQGICHAACGQRPER